jgi:hypothetical protein
MLLGIGDASPDYTGMGLVDLIKFQFSLLLSTYTVVNSR